MHAPEGAGSKRAADGEVGEGVFPFCLAHGVGCWLAAGPRDVEVRDAIVGAAVGAGVG